MPDAPSLPAMIALHQNFLGQGVLQSIATDKGYYSFDNERCLEAEGVSDIYLPKDIEAATTHPHYLWITVWMKR